MKLKSIILQGSSLGNGSHLYSNGYLFIFCDMSEKVIITAVIKSSLRHSFHPTSPTQGKQFVFKASAQCDPLVTSASLKNTYVRIYIYICS